MITTVLSEYLHLCISEGEYPEDAAPLPNVDPAELLKASDWLEMAQRWDGFCREAIAEGRADDAFACAQAVYRFCLKHQLAGGQPWEGGE